MGYGTASRSGSPANAPEPPLRNATEASPPANSHGDEDPQSGSIRRRARAFYQRNLGLVLVFFAQIFASIMSMTTRLLETGFETKFHALQIIFVRMLVTGLIGTCWMWYKDVPDFPWGARGVRRLLIIRGMAGSVGLFGLYYSLSYLDVSDATVITFLIPTIRTFVCWVALDEPFTVHEACAGMMALVGVLFIARPGFLLTSHDGVGATAILPVYIPSGAEVSTTGGILPPVKATPLERSIAVGSAILGAFSAATAYATIRVIGKRAHSLVSVNYFAVSATLSSFIIIMVHPDLHFEIPRGPVQWLLLALIGLSGFMLQILLTEGLQREKAGRATNLIYMQLIFSLIIDYLVWGTTPTLSSMLGSILIIGAAVWISLQKRAPQQEVNSCATDEEQSPLLGPETMRGDRHTR